MRIMFGANGISFNLMEHLWVETIFFQSRRAEYLLDVALTEVQPMNMSGHES
jgi:hypothetical protein